jgi:ribosomal protein L12E/L44/L45/RPP1/RPP2/uncharacterized protein Smg (DUF494 family)
MKIKARTNAGVFNIDVSNFEIYSNLQQKFSSTLNLPTDSYKLFLDGQLLNETNSPISLKDDDVIVVRTRRKIRPAVQDTEPIPNRTTILKYTGRGASRTNAPSNQSSLSPVSLRNQLQDLVNTLTGRPPAPVTSNDTQSTNSKEETEEEHEQEKEENQEEGETNKMEEVLQPPEIDADSLTVLKDMGFTEERSKKALLLNRMNTELAAEWLLQHNSDPDIDQPLTQRQLKRIVQTEKKFVPNQDAVKQLKDMGFQEKDIIKALQITNNNQEAACAWLLGDREVEIGETGFSSEDSNLIQTVLSNPIIQMGLANPRVMAAFRNMMENPASATQYINDPEIGPILLQVSQILSNS